MQRATDQHISSWLVEWSEVLKMLPDLRARELKLWRWVRSARAPVFMVIDVTADPPPILEWGHRGVSAVLFKGVHDAQPESFRRWLNDRAGYHQVLRLLPGIAALIASEPNDLGRAIASLVRDPSRFSQVQDLAVSASCSTRTLERHFQTRGLVSPRTLLACVRLAHVHCGGRLTIPSATAVALQVGFADAHAMRSAVRAATACASMSAFFALPGERLAELLESELRGTKPRRI
jgi:hypothetical protein